MQYLRGCNCKVRLCTAQVWWQRSCTNSANHFSICTYHFSSSTGDNCKLAVLEGTKALIYRGCFQIRLIDVMICFIRTHCNQDHVHIHTLYERGERGQSKSNSAARNTKSYEVCKIKSALFANHTYKSNSSCLHLTNPLHYTVRPNNGCHDVKLQNSQVSIRSCTQNKSGSISDCCCA